MVYKAYTLANFRQIPQLSNLSEEQKNVIEVVGSVVPFKSSNYVVDELIDWDNFQKDPFFILTFPQQGMLSENHFNSVQELIRIEDNSQRLKDHVRAIRESLNPNPAGQKYNVPYFNGIFLKGIQHKYRETVLFFPSQGQTCHAYCTFCFRWPQFSMPDLKFSMPDFEQVVCYIQEHDEVTDLLFTGGDPLVMSTHSLEHYFDYLLDANIPHLHTIRIGTKSLTHWPYRFTTDKDADDLLRLFEKVIKSGLSISIMAHFNHPRALETIEAQKAISRIRSTGAVIRSQSPVLKNINDNSVVWSDMWRKQVDLGIIPYYMFVARDTGAQNYFAVTLARAHQIFIEAYSSVSGICRTVRGPSMSCDPGKIQIVGVTEVLGEKVFVLHFIQARNPEWIRQVFFARYNPNAMWISDLEPVFGEKEFFFVQELKSMHNVYDDLYASDVVH